jgi:hypothetical protein
MKNRYLITTAVPGAEVDTKLLASFKNYCKLNKAKLLILQSTPVYKTDILDARLPEASIVLKDKQLNSKIRISTIPINPMAVDPVAGLQRQSQTDGSFIFASPKQRLKIVPNSNIKLPHALMTTGAVTHAYYRNTRNGIIASEDHVKGGLIVETNGDTEYHFRQVQGDSEGCFIDLGVKYSPTKKSKIQTTALIPGDIHVGSTDPKVEAVIFDLISKLKPTNLVLHDLFDGISINPHTKHKKILRGVQHTLLNISAELDLTYQALSKYSKNVSNTIIVRSNHDDFIDRWLEEGDFIEEPQNLVEGLHLALAKSKGENPLENGIRRRGRLSGVRFLGLEEDFKLTPKKIQLGAHGHLGSNGARGSTAAIEKAYATSISGHSHTPEILRGAWVVGTSTYLKLEYNKGPSSWMQTLCILYPNGHRQLINIIDGKYTI